MGFTIIDLSDLDTDIYSFYLFMFCGLLVFKKYLIKQPYTKIAVNRGKFHGRDKSKRLSDFVAHIFVCRNSLVFLGLFSTRILN